MAEQTINIQVGNFSNYVGTHIWNIRHAQAVEATKAEENTEGAYPSSLYRSSATDRSPRLLMIDFRNNIEKINAKHRVQYDPTNLLWGGKVSAHQQHNASSGKTWSEYLEPQVNPKCGYDLPLWAETSAFDSYFSGVQSDIITADIIEEIFDRFRYMAEECDHLSSVQLFMDAFDGFGGLSCALLESIREEVPSACISTWAFTEGANTKKSAAANPIGNLLHSLNQPMCYTRLLESSNMIVPICKDALSYIAPLWPNIAGPYHSSAFGGSYSVLEKSAFIAAAIETALSPMDVRCSNTISSSDKVGQQDQELNSIAVNSVYEWVRDVTVSGRLPMCLLETCLPLPIPLNASSTEITARSFWGTFSSSRPVEGSLNPFTKSLSAVLLGSPHLTAFTSSTGASNAFPDRRRRPFSNVISARALTGADFLGDLYSKCLEVPCYAVTSVRETHTTLTLADSFPQIFSYVNEKGFSVLENSEAKNFWNYGNRANESVVDSIRGDGYVEGRFGTNVKDVRVREVSCLSALGSDASVGRHLEKIAAHVAGSVGVNFGTSEGGNDRQSSRRDDVDSYDEDAGNNLLGEDEEAGSGPHYSQSTGSVHALRVQLARVGMEDEDCVELVEKLRLAARRYLC